MKNFKTISIIYLCIFVALIVCEFCYLLGREDGVIDAFSSLRIFYLPLSTLILFPALLSRKKVNHTQKQRVVQHDTIICFARCKVKGFPIRSYPTRILEMKPILRFLISVSSHTDLRFDTLTDISLKTFYNVDKNAHFDIMPLN